MFGKVSSFFRSTASSSSSSKSSRSTQAESSSSAGVVSGMKPREAPLAGYLMARSATHRKVEGPALQDLRAGHESVQQGSDLLPLGRSNVIQDIEKAKDAHLLQRQVVSTKLRNFLTSSLGYPSFDRVPKNIRNRAIAAASQYFQTGTCHSYAASISPLHAAKLPGMKDERAIVGLCNYPGKDHVWSEMMPKGMGRNGNPVLHGEDVIMDGWCKENLAILREDSEYARLDKNGKGGHLRHHDLLNHESGPKALKEVKGFKAKIESNRPWKRECGDDLNFLVTSRVKLNEKGLRNAESVFHEDFRKQAGKALHKDAKAASPGEGARVPDADPVSEQAKRASMAEIQAVGVARSLGANIREAKAEAPRIIASAKEMFPGP